VEEVHAVVVHPDLLLLLGGRVAAGHEGR